MNQIPCHTNNHLFPNQLTNQAALHACAESHKNRAKTHIQHTLKMRIFVRKTTNTYGRKRKNTDYRR